SNIVKIGGDFAAHNAVTSIELYTAPNTTTTASTLAADITGVGASSLFHARGAIEADGTITAGGNITAAASAVALILNANAATVPSTYFQIAGVTHGLISASGDELKFYTSSGLDLRLTIGNGLQVGSPTGGDKGAGTINLAGDIYKNNSAYTNPDFVFEYAFARKLTNAPLGWKLRSLRETKAYAERWHHLPGVHRDRSMGMFDRGDWVAEKMEEVHLHLFTHEDRIENLEGDNQRLKDECTTLRAQIVELQLAA
ncbi:hypothetical protein LCGC14_3163320, partial [marine sediment metagenome]